MSSSDRLNLTPWSSRRRRFQANLRALQSHNIDPSLIQSAWDDPATKIVERYQLHQAPDGNFQILDTRTNTWLAGLQDHKSVMSQVTPETFKGQLRGPLAFDGIGHGWLIPHILEISERSYLNYSAPLYIVEPDLVSFAMALHFQDLQSWFTGPRLRVFLGDHALHTFFESLDTHQSWTLPASCIFNPLRSRPTLNLQAAVDKIRAARNQERTQTLHRIKTHYGVIDNPAWRTRFTQAIQQPDSRSSNLKGESSVPPLRVLGITTRYSTVLRYSMEELQSAAATCGIAIDMQICIEPDDQSLEKNYIAMIDQLKPDLLVSISRMRHEMPDLPRNIPALCWDQDNLQCMRDPAARADMVGLTFVAGHGAVFGSMHLDWPLPACIFCHPAGMTHRYHPAPPSAEEAAQFGADISYVSHAAGTPEQLRDQLRAKWIGGASDFLPLFDDSSAQVIASTRNGMFLEFLDFMSLMQSVAQSRKLPLPPPVSSALIADLRLLADRVFRHQTLEWVSTWCTSRGKRLRIWGNGWNNHPSLAQWAAGAALPGEQAQAVFRASTINLQIIETGIFHSRLLDGWAAGGFFLIRQAHRAQDEKRIGDCHQIGLRAQSEAIDTIADLESRASVELRNLWRPLAPEFAAFAATKVFPGFRMWRALVPAPTLIPQLTDVMFRDAAGFERLADLYVSAPDSRRQISQSLVDTLHRHLSYDARWRDFLGHIAANLGY